MKSIVLAVLMLSLATVLEAQDKRGRCSGTPVDSAVISGVVYRDCDVDRPARRRGTAASRINWNPSPSEVAGGRCFRADFQFVVDSLGAIEPLTVRLVSSNSPGFAEAVRASLTGLRFEPARLGNAPVRQLVVHEERAAIRVAVSGAPSGGGPPPRC